MKKRVFLIVLDSFGIGALPDAEDFGDKNANTLKSISKSDKFNIDNLKKLGFCNIDNLTFLDDDSELKSIVARLKEKSKGKDTTIGHWEIAGIVSKKPLPTFPDGFPESLIKEFSRLTNRGVLCNKPYSGTEVIKDYGEEHLKTGDLIVYTSADSVFQIAAHEDVVSTEKLYEYCKIARKLLNGETGVGRVIARPFNDVNPFKRTSGRHDFSLEPPEETLLDYLKGKNFDVIAVGKINDIFVGRGITEYVYTKNNSEGMSKTSEYQNKDFHGICFTNLVDFDMIYGHRNNTDGYAEALAKFDSWLPEFIANMRPDDALIITADHGCDPGDTSTDHTREYVPFILYYENIEPQNLGTVSGLDFVSDTVKNLLENDFYD